MEHRLGSQDVIVLDCQTTGAAPAHGHLIELAWSVVSAERPDRPVRCFTFGLPAGETVPVRIRSLTGITDVELQSGIGPSEGWWLLRASMRTPSGGWLLPVAHYARFEKLWLEDLRGRVDPGEDPPLDFVCTREIARRLYPDIPRKGLHALSGFLGRSMPELKRAADHVRATAFVWSRMVTELESRGIDTLDVLQEWLSEPPPKSRGRHRYRLPRDARLSLPEEPGVYRFLGADSRVLYVGKATSLRQRVSSYFTKRKADEKTLELVTQVHGLHATPCGSPLEAALLECRLIRRLRPPYNRALKAGDENLWFSSGDWRAWSQSPGGSFTEGPYPVRGVHDRLVWLLDVASGRLPVREETVKSLFWMDRESVEPGALEDGVSIVAEVFREREVCASRNRLLEYGKVLWQEMLERRSTEEEEGTEETVEEVEKPEKLLTSSDVASRLLWTVADAALLDRRHRWFRLLAWSTLVWVPTGGGRGGERFLVLRNGGVVRSGAGAPAPAVPPPVKRGVPVLDRSGYELLKVLTTELRRLSSSGSPVSVLLPTGRVLEGGTLASLLGMV